MPGPRGPGVPAGRDLLRFTTCGSVDDGKSTLIGRILLDTGALQVDALAAVERYSRGRGRSSMDLSLFTDGLEEERAQGITIDVAYRHLRGRRRDFIIADAPGHEEFTRNMVTAASTAHLAVVLVDARHGVRLQTRRHAYVAHLMGVPRLVIAVNKMDLLGWSEEVFRAIVRDYQAFAGRLGAQAVTFVPISALVGDMVVRRGENLGWYDGPTLMDVLESAPAGHGSGLLPFRFPVQWVCRSDGPQDLRTGGLAGLVESGRVSVGDEVTVMPTGVSTRVTEIRLGDAMLRMASAGQSVVLGLEGEVGVSRGDLLVPAADRPLMVRTIQAMVCWFSERPLSPSRKYLLRHSSREVCVQSIEVAWRMDLSALERVVADGLVMNDVGFVTVQLAVPVVSDPYAVNRGTGGFILVDQETSDTVAAGMIQ